MIRINSIIDDIKELRNAPTYRSALFIANLLDANRKLFAGKIDEMDFNYLLKNFEELSHSHPKDHDTDAFVREYNKYFESLLFHFNKII